MLPSRERLEQLFDKPYGSPAPTEDQWREFYAEGVHFIDPTQEKQGLEGLSRCPRRPGETLR